MDILSYAFMQRAFAAGIMIAIICSIIGTFIVLRRMSMIGDALSHVSLSGVAAGMLLGFYPFLGALVMSALAALFIEFLRNYFKKYAEISLAVVMSGGIGLATILISLGRAFNVDIFSYLFGSIVAVTPADLWLILAVGIFILLSMIYIYRRLFYMTFDEDAAKFSGVNTGAINIFFTILTALTVALSIRVVGTLLVSSLMVIPAAVGIQIGKSFKATMAISIIVALVSVIVGLIASFIWNLAPGGTIVITSVLILVVVLLWKRGRE
ncbi:MAG: metal ABC transporter permease [Thermoanaerobacteraceae bacterium]|nr:metal ABC transporter permease [Thermoanaerobacteraceae bacterium]